MSAAVGPRRAVPFLNRLGARKQMRELLAARRRERRPCLVFVHGPEGMGRSSLAGEFFHEERDAFDGVYIEVAARQPDGRLVPQGELLGQALRGLGQAETELAASDTARSHAFQRLAAGRRFLLVVKDAASAEQVTGLIPVAAPEAALVVTTRTMIRELLHHDFADIPLGKLPQAECRELLVTRLGPTADRVPTATLHELADLCDGFPLLIRILAAQLARRPRAAQRVLADLRGSEAALLGMDHTHRMTRFVDLAHEFLVRDVQAAYRAVSLLPGPDFGVAAAAVALESTEDEAARRLDDLVDAHLLTYDEDTDRYGFYRVVRADARRRAREVGGADWYRATTARVVEWYLRQAVPRDAALAGRWRVGPVFDEPFEPVDRVDATAWFDTEWHSLAACVPAAHDLGLHETAWQLCVALFKYLHLHGHYDTWLDTHRLGVRSAQAADDPAGLMLVTSQRGSAYLAVGELDAAEEDFTASWEAAARIGHPLGEQSALEWLGKVAARRGDLEQALARFAESEAVIDRSGARISVEQQGRMRALLDLHRARVALDRRAWDEAMAVADGAARYFSDRGEWENHAKSLLVRGRAASGAGDPVAAAGSFQEAVELFARDNARRAHADAAVLLGDALAAGGRDAVPAYRVAREIYLSLGDSRTDEVSARLDALLNAKG
ncbi:NB-ARC domain-containing protein [Actinosynnema sp. CA-248983]